MAVSCSCCGFTCTYYLLIDVADTVRHISLKFYGHKVVHICTSLIFLTRHLDYIKLHHLYLISIVDRTGDTPKCSNWVYRPNALV